MFGNIFNDILLTMQEKECRHYSAKVDKRWKKEMEEAHANAKPVLDLVDPEIKDSHLWVIHEMFIPEGVEKYVDDHYGLPEQTVQKQKAYTETYNGSRAALMAMYRMVTNQLDDDSFILADKDVRVMEATILKFFGISRSSEYDDIEDKEVADVVDYTKLLNGKKFFVNDEILEEAFQKVQKENPEYKLEVKLKEGWFNIHHVDDGKSDVVDGKPTDNEVVVESTVVGEENNEPKLLELKKEQKTDNEVVAESSKSEEKKQKSTSKKKDNKKKSEPNTSIPVVKDESKKEKTVPITFVDPNTVEEKPLKPEKMSQEVFEVIENTLKKAYPDQEKDHTYYEIPGGLYQLCYANGAAVTIDPDIVIGNGLNVIGTVKIPNPHGGFRFDTAMVSIEKDPDIAIKIFQNPSYVLDPDEHQRSLSRIFQNPNIYSFIDMTGMSKHFSELSPEDFTKLGRKLTAIVNLMNNGTICASRFRFGEFDSIDKFTLVSDGYVTIPMPTEMLSTISHLVIKVEQDNVSIYTINNQTGSPIHGFTIEYGEI